MLSSSRRTFLKTATAAGLSAGFVFAETPKITAAPLGDRLFLLTGAGCNIVVNTGNNGVLMVDGGLAENAAALAQAVAALPNGGAVRTLFNTHWHPEQTGSNLSLGTAGATIIAQENTRLWLTQDITYPWDGRKFKKFSKVAQPNKAFYDKGEIAGIRYGYIADAAHTDGDLYVYFHEQNVLAVGDAAYGQGWPFVDYWTGGWIGGIVGGLQRIQTVANKDTKIVPGQGPLLTSADIATQVEMYGTIFDRLNQMLNKGHSPSEAVAAKPAKEYEAKMGNPDLFIRRSFESLWAYLSPDA
ncbi:MAG TPA: MBL fold metallo-hydrolase [Bryobacteraceae bacterium]|nr:MBL fold metallo-hydrolase [Bryobacteraceae bacterium]